MKIIDFEKKGQTVRFYLGNDDLKEWCGDDWDDAPYEHNAGIVYDDYLAGYTDMTFDFDDYVLEPADGCLNSDYCKNDMINRRVPCIVVVPKEMASTSWSTDFQYWVGADQVLKFYFGDQLDCAYVYDHPVMVDEHYNRIAHPVICYNTYTTESMKTISTNASAKEQ